MNVRRWTSASPCASATFAATDDPLVSVVVVAFGTGPVLTGTLESLAATLPDGRAEVIVVDNPHPTEPTRAEVELRLFTGGVHILSPDVNLGFGGGCELGALLARGQYLVFLNPDVVCPTGWLEPLIETASDPTVAIAAPVLVHADGRVQEAGQRLSADGSTAPITDRPDALTDVDYTSAACWVMRSAEHEQLGGFDPAYHPAYFEDVDLALRAHSLGKRVVVDPRVDLVHLHGHGTPSTADPAFAQRDVLRAKWPEITWRQPVANSR